MPSNSDHNKLAVEVFDRNAKQYQDKFMDVNLYASELDRFCEGLPQNAKVLDLACGPGNMSRHLLDQRPDLQIFGSDLAPNMIKLAKQNNPAAQFEVRDCRKLEDINAAYDGILCAFCLPYLTVNETKKLISDCKRLLVKGGLVYFSFMKGNHLDSGLQKTSAGNELYFYYYSENDLRDLLTDFNVLLVSEKASPPTATMKTTDLIILAAKR